MSKRRLVIELLWLFAFVFCEWNLQGCSTCQSRSSLERTTQESTSNDLDAGTVLTSPIAMKATPVFPCNVTYASDGAIADATALASDPNNCGACGTLCGTYKGFGAGYTFVQGTCSHYACVGNTADQSTLDCWDQNGSIVGRGGANGPFSCINIMSSGQNCGALGTICFGQGCTYGNCFGTAKPVPPLTLQGPDAATYTDLTDYTISGGRGPFNCVFAPYGNYHNDSIVSTGSVDGGHSIDGGVPTCFFTANIRPSVNVIQVWDSVGNQAIKPIVTP